jgi:hypothetical protein
VEEATRGEVGDTRRRVGVLIAAVK